MALRTVLKYLALAVGVFLAVSVVVSVVAAVVSTVIALVTAAVTVLVIASLLYGGVKLYSLLGGDGGSADRTASDGRFDVDLGVGSDTGTAESEIDRVDRLKRRYAEGELSERELERRLELELDDGGAGRLDRELDRSRR